MKKFALLAIIVAGIAFQYCSPTRKARKTEPAITYETHVQPVIMNHCSPCHIPPKGNKEPLHTYEGASRNIDESIRRIQLNPGERGFMPFKHPKLPDSTIQLFVKWKEQGLVER